MLKNIFANPKISCSKCNSKNTVLSKKPLSKVNTVEKLLGLHRMGMTPPFLGQVYICCKDCNAEVSVCVM